MASFVISFYIFLLCKVWTFDVWENVRVAVLLDAHPISSMVVTDIYIKTNFPNPLAKVGWGDFFFCHSLRSYPDLFRFP